MTKNSKRWGKTGSPYHGAYLLQTVEYKGQLIHETPKAYLFRFDPVAEGGTSVEQWIPKKGSRLHGTDTIEIAGWFWDVNLDKSLHPKNFNKKQVTGNSSEFDLDAVPYGC